MSNLDALIKDLVIANRILAKEDVVDAYGHVAVRNPNNPKTFFLSRSLAPELIEKDDIMEFGMDGQPVDKNILTNETVYYPDKAAELLPTRQY